MRVFSRCAAIYEGWTLGKSLHCMQYNLLFTQLQYKRRACSEKFQKPDDARMTQV